MMTLTRSVLAALVLLTDRHDPETLIAARRILACIPSSPSGYGQQLGDARRVLNAAAAEPGSLVALNFAHFRDNLPTPVLDTDTEATANTARRFAIDTDTEAGQLAALVAAIATKAQRLRLSERSKAVHAARRARGIRNRPQSSDNCPMRTNPKLRKKLDAITADSSPETRRDAAELIDRITAELDKPNTPVESALRTHLKSTERTLDR